MYILILSVILRCCGASATSAEFSSKDACVQAGAEAVKTFDSIGRDVNFICVAK